ncbi:alpha/beta fold hydrolase [Corynebacterium resistens]|uniref:alpha/beta fold hydrolase n=1 Tax=Corynebacterium resistens TaxID=258224 RepID=UPI002352FDC7|nr:alpha/beta fold hydrolase [Corynebacterium resistens]
MTTTRHFGHTIREHTLEVPWDHADPARLGSFSLYAREIIADGGENRPYLVYFQGGPGFPAPRPQGVTGLIAEALKHFRVILFDQRGTGRSFRLDANLPAEELSSERLALLRQEQIVEDAEALRRYLGAEQWSVYGQSFGGFIITSYLSRYPEVVEQAYLTGGLPALHAPLDDVYRTTFQKLRYRHEMFYREFPWAERRIREIAHHLDNSHELLPTGERLSSRRFRTIGIDLGRGAGFYSLAYLLEEPFYTIRGEKRLRRDFLAQVGEAVSFEAGPLYAAIHESIYGGVGGQSITGWAAHRVREEIAGFEENADPQGEAPYYLTGEHIFPWQFEEDPALRLFQGPAEELARRTWASSPYSESGLQQAKATAAAAVYVDDVFVPFEYSMETAEAYRDLRPHITNKFQHDGIRWEGGPIFSELHAKIRDH